VRGSVSPDVGRTMIYIVRGFSSRLIEDNR
jgi:hypothetical protein